MSNIPLDHTFVILIDKNFYSPIAIYDPRFHLKRVEEDQGLYVMLIQSLYSVREEAIMHRGESREQQEAEEKAYKAVIEDLKKMLKLLFFTHYETNNFLIFLGVPRTYFQIGSKTSEMRHAERAELSRKKQYWTSLKWVGDSVEKKYGKKISEWDGNVKESGLAGDIQNYLYRLMAEVYSH